MDRLIRLGIVHGFGGGGSVQPMPAAPATTDPAVEEAAAKERALARLRKGRSSTILTSLIGQPDGVTGKKTLLGQ